MEPVTEQKPIFDASKKEVAKVTMTRKQSEAIGQANRNPTPAPEVESETEYSDSEEDKPSSAKQSDPVVMAMPVVETKNIVPSNMRLETPEIKISYDSDDLDSSGSSGSGS